jgi:hypothetical protein
MKVIYGKTKKKKSEKELIRLDTKSVSIWKIQDPEKAKNVIERFLNREGIDEDSMIMVIITNRTDRSVKVKFD